MTDSPHDYTSSLTHRASDPAVLMLEVVLGEIRHVRSDMVTRAEHIEAQNGHKAEHAAIRAEIAAGDTAVRGEVGTVRDEVDEIKAASHRVPRWLRVLGTVAAIVGVVCSATLGVAALIVT